MAKSDSTETSRARGLYRNVEGSWTPLETRFVSETDGVVNYEAITPGFSVFAIGVDRGVNATGTTEPTTTPETDAAGTTDSSTETDDETPGFGLLTGLVALLGVLVVVSRRRTPAVDD